MLTAEKRALRSEMEHDARERLLGGVLAALCDDPEGPLGVAALLIEARVSAVQFEAEFGDEEGLLAAASARAGEILIERIEAACGKEGSWTRQIGRGLRSLLEQLAEQPVLTRVVMRSLPRRSRGAYHRYQEMLEGLAALLVEGRTVSPAGTELPANVEMLAVGAAEAIIAGEVEAGRVTGLPAMGPEILFSLLVPFLGPERASAEMRRAR